MAVVKEVEKPIKAHQYIYDSIAYVLSPENKNGDEKCFTSTCMNCINNGIDSLAKQFYETRSIWNKDNNILAHHYIQSFSPNENITPELAHQIGVELAKKTAPNFQVIISTHIDKDHIHNHFIINSVNLATGLKWKADLTTRKNMRKESDSLCQQYGLNIIKNENGLRGIDQATQKLAEKGKSWKVKLCKDLDEAVHCCNSKKDFIKFMNLKGWQLRYKDTDRHITFELQGEEKKIRADTLAKQFGDFYKKENLEKMMGYYSIPTEHFPPPKPKKTSKPFVSEWEKYEKSYFKKTPPPVSISETLKMQKHIKQSTNPLIALLRIIMKLIIRKKRKKCFDKKYHTLHRYCKQQQKYKAYTPSLQEQIEKIEKLSRTAGNISYKNLISAQGDNFRVKIALSSVAKMYAYPIFFSARLYKDYAILTVKEKDKTLLKQILGVEDIKILDRHNRKFTGIEKYRELKKQADQLNVKLEFLDNISPEQLELLKDEKERFVSLVKDGKTKIAFLPANKKFILHTLFSDEYNDNLFSVSRNSKVNTKLKSEALLGGQKMCYRILTKEQIEKLNKNESIKNQFAVFRKNIKGEDLGDGKYNIAFKESDEEEINELLKNPEPTKRKL